MAKTEAGGVGYPPASFGRFWAFLGVFGRFLAFMGVLGATLRSRFVPSIGSLPGISAILCASRGRRGTSDAQRMLRRGAINERQRGRDREREEGQGEGVLVQCVFRTTRGVQSVGMTTSPCRDETAVTPVCSETANA